MDVRKGYAYIYTHETGRLILDLYLQNAHYGDYPIDDAGAEAQIKMAIADAADYGIDEVVLKIGKPFK